MLGSGNSDEIEAAIEMFPPTEGTLPLRGQEYIGITIVCIHCSVLVGEVACFPVVTSTDEGKPAGLERKECLYRDGQSLGATVGCFCGSRIVTADVVFGVGSKD